MAHHTHQQRRDQRGAPHQPQRGQKTEGEGQGVQKSISPWCSEQLEVTAWCGKEESLVHTGPVALQPSSQWGWHHVGLQLHQKRPHGYLILTLVSFLNSKPYQKTLTCIYTTGSVSDVSRCCDQLGTKKRSSCCYSHLARKKLCSYINTHNLLHWYLHCFKWDPHGNNHS